MTAPIQFGAPLTSSLKIFLIVGSFMLFDPRRHASNVETYALKTKARERLLGFEIQNKPVCALFFARHVGSKDRLSGWTATPRHCTPSEIAPRVGGCIQNVYNLKTIATNETAAYSPKIIPMCRNHVIQQILQAAPLRCRSSSGARPLRHEDRGQSASGTLALRFAASGSGHILT
jgi:hypothetical protein